MCKKANELIRKQQIRRPALSRYEMLQAFMINFILVTICRHEAMLTNRLRRKSTNKKKNSNKSLVQDITYRKIEL